MVESVKTGGLGGTAPLIREEARKIEGGFTVDTGGGLQAQKARFSTIASTITSTGAATGAATGASTGAVMGLESMLALQSINEAIDRDRAARERGTAMIAALTDLQRAMLTEEDPALALRSLSALAVDGPLADDPELAAVLRAVVLRSRVEVARRGRRAY